jgi:prevent-host-death family protein
MADVSIRHLRNHAGDVVERAEQGERLTITRAGKPVAQLVPLH